MLGKSRQSNRAILFYHSIFKRAHTRYVKTKRRMYKHNLNNRVGKHFFRIYAFQGLSCKENNQLKRYYWLTE